MYIVGTFNVTYHGIPAFIRMYGPLFWRTERAPTYAQVYIHVNYNYLDGEGKVDLEALAEEINYTMNEHVKNATYVFMNVEFFPMDEYNYYFDSFE